MFYLLDDDHRIYGRPLDKKVECCSWWPILTTPKVYLVAEAAFMKIEHEPRYNLRPSGKARDAKRFTIYWVFDDKAYLLRGQLLPFLDLKTADDHVLSSKIYFDVANFVTSRYSRFHPDYEDPTRASEFVQFMAEQPLSRWKMKHGIHCLQHLTGIEPIVEDHYEDWFFFFGDWDCYPILSDHWPDLAKCIAREPVEWREFLQNEARWFLDHLVRNKIAMVARLGIIDLLSDHDVFRVNRIDQFSVMKGNHVLYLKDEDGCYPSHRHLSHVERKYVVDHAPVTLFQEWQGETPFDKCDDKAQRAIVKRMNKNEQKSYRPMLTADDETLVSFVGAALLDNEQLRLTTNEDPVEAMDDDDSYWTKESYLGDWDEDDSYWGDESRWE